MWAKSGVSGYTYRLELYTGDSTPIPNINQSHASDPKRERQSTASIFTVVTNSTIANIPKSSQVAIQ